MDPSEAIEFPPIYLYNHTERINQYHQPLSFENPKFFTQPPRPKVPVILSPELQKDYDDRMFKYFRDKMIMSRRYQSIGYAPVKPWGKEAPSHYFNRQVIGNYFSVPSISRPKEYLFVPKLLTPNPDIVKGLSIENIDQYSIKHLVQLALHMRDSKNKDGKAWYSVLSKFDRKYHNLTTD